MDDLQYTFAVQCNWEYTCSRLLEAVDPAQRPAVQEHLHGLHTTSPGLRNWVMALCWRGAVLPGHVPPELIDVYLTDAEAVPLHDCEDCGLAVPVRPSRVAGMEEEPELVYFPFCPLCGGRTGWYFHCTRQTSLAAAPSIAAG